MLSFLKTIVDSIVFFIEMIGNVLTGIVQFIGMIPQYMGLLTISVNTVPGVLIPFIMLGITLSLVWLIITIF